MNFDERAFFGEFCAHCADWEIYRAQIRRRKLALRRKNSRPLVNLAVIPHGEFSAREGVQGRPVRSCA